MKWRLLLLAFATVATVACQERMSSSPAPRSPAAPPHASGASATASSAGEAQQALDRLDTRVVVPLLPMMANHQKEQMRDHLLAVQEIILAASSDDFGAIERAAGRMGYSEPMAQMCEHMGAGAPGFTEQALAFHHSADTIAAAARRGNRAGVMQALGTTLQKCTGCHATFRQAVVDEATWNRLASIPAPTGHAAPR